MSFIVQTVNLTPHNIRCMGKNALYVISTYKKLYSYVVTNDMLWLMLLKTMLSYAAWFILVVFSSPSPSDGGLFKSLWSPSSVVRRPLTFLYNASYLKAIRKILLKLGLYVNLGTRVYLISRSFIWIHMASWQPL